MSLSFTANHTALSTWGFSAGDIAVLAGAARSVGTWVKSRLEDQALLEFMRIDPEHIVPRRGLVDSTALHRRWDLRLRLLHNGEVKGIGGGYSPMVEDMGTFSWCLTLITCAMDCALQVKDLRLAMTMFLTALFDEHTDGNDYILRELPKHVQGWVSAGVVRNITSHARAYWTQLVDQKAIRPGSVPVAELPEIVRFLVWLTGARKQTESKTFETASSDVFAMAKTLHSIGLDIIQPMCKSDADSSTLESRIVVMFDPGAFSTGIEMIREIEITSQSKSRMGMRVPLSHREECVSGWPDAMVENDQRRSLFRQGFDHATTLILSVLPPQKTSHEVIFQISDRAELTSGRAEERAYRIASDLFLLATKDLVMDILQIIKGCPALHNQRENGLFRHINEDPASLSKLQCFTMGYYYGFLSQVCDDSKLTLREVYGNWTWNDTELISSLRRIISSHRDQVKRQSSGNLTTTLNRKGMLQLLGLLVAGAGKEQLEALDASSIGIHGKITVVATSLLGILEPRWDSAANYFSLLDIDATAIPSNARGIITAGEQHTSTERPVILMNDDLLQVERIDRVESTDDLTSHIEPDWEHDVQRCQVVFRFEGRIASRMSPHTLETAWWPDQSKEMSNLRRDPPTKSFQVLRLENSIGLCPQLNPVSVASNPCQPPLLITTKGSAKARLFLTAQYSLSGFTRITLPDDWPEIGWYPQKYDDSDVSPPIILHEVYSDVGETFCTGRGIILT